MRPASSFQYFIIAFSLSLYCGGAACKEVVAVVSAKSTLASLSKNQIMDIFMGKTNRFPNGLQALPINQKEGSAARDAFYLRFADKSAAQIKAHWSKIIFTGRGQPPMEVADDDEVKKHITENPNAIGYIEQMMVDDRVRIITVQ